MSSQRVWGAPLGRVQPAWWGSKSRVIHVGWPRCGLVTWQYQHTLGIAVSWDAGRCWVCSHLDMLVTSWNHFSASIRPKALLLKPLMWLWYPIPALNEQCQYQHNISCQCWISLSWCQWFRNHMACIWLCVVTSFYIPAAKMTLKAVLYLYVSYF